MTDVDSVVIPARVCSSKGTQVPSLPLRPYQEAQERTKRDMRSEIITTLKTVALKYVHFKPGPALVKLMEDIIQSRVWSQTFPGCRLPQTSVCGSRVQVLQGQRVHKTNQGHCQVAET